MGADLIQRQNITQKHINAALSLVLRFLEKVYQKVLLIELKKSGLECISEVPIKVYYDGFNVEDYQVDDVVQTSSDVSRLHDDFGYKSNIEIEEGIEEFVDWYRLFIK